MKKPELRLLGESGEKKAEEFLRQKGFRWLASNWRTKWGEIDLVMKDGPTLIFVEVKTRAYDDPTPEEQVIKRPQLAPSDLCNHARKHHKYICGK